MSRLDLLLLLMVLIWGTNFSIIKVALAEFPPLAFNSLRLIIASTLFLATLGVRRWQQRPGPALAGRDRAVIVALGLIGHFAYQLCFLGGVSRTSVANSALIIGTTPMIIAILTTSLGHERVTRVQWTGVVLSVAGMAILAGRDAELSRESLIGDLLIVAGNLCWAIYTVTARPLLRRHSPLVVTGYSMAVGTVLYAAAAGPTLAALEWCRVSVGAWLGLAISGSGALYIAYLIWYTSVQRLGNIRTSMYSNLVPLVAILVAVIWLGERIDASKAAGAAAILTGLGLSRVSRSSDTEAPAEA